MRAVEIKLFLIEKELKRPFRTSFGTTKVRKIVLTRIRFEEDIVSWGECVAGNGPWYSYETYKTCWYVISKYASKLVLGKDFKNPTEVNEALEPIRGHEMAKYAVEAPFYSAFAESVGLPLYKYLGGVRDKIESGVSIGIKSSIRELLEEVEKYLEEGYRRIKIKIKPGWDKEPLDAIRENFGDIRLQVDANAAYKPYEMDKLEALDKYNLLMIEQPFHYKDLVAHSRLQRRMKTPICLDESITGYQLAEAALELGSCRVINIKPGRVGGISESLEIHDLAGRKSVGLWIGGMLETGIGRAYLVALATLQNINYPNDISASERYWHQDIVEPEFRLERDGTIRVPRSKGLGVSVNEDEIDRLTKKTLVVRV